MSLNPYAMPFAPVRRYVGNNRTNPQKMRDGTIRFRLLTGSWLDIAASRAVKLWDVNLGISVAVSPDGRAVALSHPNCFALQDGTTKLRALDRSGVLGYAYFQNDFVIMANFNTYCIFESGLSEPLSRPLYSEELLDETHDFVGDLFAREISAEASDLATSSVRHLTYHNIFDEFGTIERCHVFGYDIVQDLTGVVSVASTEETMQLRFSPLHGLVQVSTPTLQLEARTDLQAVMLSTEDLTLFNRKRKLCARRAMFIAGINASSFYCRELHRPIHYMYALERRAVPSYH